MNTASSTKGTGHPLGLTEILFFIGGLIVVVGILASVVYVSAPGTIAPAAVNEPVIVNDAMDPHVIKEASIAAANAKRAYLQQRRGEWETTMVIAGSEFEQDHPRGEWAGGIVPTGQTAFQEQRRGEWMIAENATGQDAMQDHPRGEWAGGTVPTGQSGHQEQRKGEQTAGNH